MKTKGQFFVAEEDTNLFNVFSIDEFDDDGFLLGHEDEEGYHISDLDIVAWFDDFNEACNWFDNRPQENDNKLKEIKKSWNTLISQL
jgi:hypothetical protein